MLTSIIDRYEPYNIPLHGVRLPKFEVAQEDRKKYNVKDDATNKDILRTLCVHGFKKLNLKKDSEQYITYANRLKYELEIINELEFTDYILLVWHVINFCKKNNIPTGIGRGSAAGSLVLYVIGVTGVDPIKYDLYFERFISRTRAKKKIVDGVTYFDGNLMVDIDTDICYYNRHKVLEFLEKSFSGNVSKILTLNTLSGRLLIKEVGKTVGNKSETEMTKVANLIPKLFGNIEDLETAYQSVPELKEWCDTNKEIYNICLGLRDLVKNKGVHPSGVMISYGDIQENCPIERAKEGNVSGFDMRWASLLNVKLDCLGLRSVSVIHDACQRAGINVEDINVDDPFIYQQLQNINCPHGLFQIEAHTAFKALQKIKPRNFNELSAVLAIARPGALHFLDTYTKFTNYNQLELPDVESAKLKEILAETGGCILYQETLIRIAKEVFGLTAEEGELLRRACGKKKKEEMQVFEEKIKNKGRELNIQKSADFFWTTAIASADYLFNASHSRSYSALCAMTIFLKYKYPQQFFLALLNMVKHEPDPRVEISKIEQELPHFGIKLLSPCILKSQTDFTPEGKNIRFGLCLIKGISDKAIEKLKNFRKVYENKFQLFHAAQEVGLSLSVLTPLIQAGAFEDFRESRSKTVLEAQLWNLLTDRELPYAMKLGEKYNYNLIAIIKAFKTELNEKGKTIITEKRFETIKKKYEVYKNIYQINSTNENFANWYYERMLMGYSCATLLRDVFEEKYPYLNNISQALIAKEKQDIRFIGTVIDKASGVSKKGARWERFTVTDETGTINVMLFNDRIDEIKSINSDKLPKEDNIIYVAGIRMGDAVFANMIYIEDSQIYIKLGQFNRDKEAQDNENSNDKIVDNKL